MKKVLALAGGIVIVALAAWFFQEKKEQAYTASDKPLFPDFTLAELNGLKKVRIHKDGADTELINTPGKGWLISEFGDYPADTAKIRKLLHTILETRVIEEKTDNPAYYDVLGVADPSSSDTQGIHLGLYGEKDWGLIVGKTSNKIKNARYARVEGQTKALLINQLLEIPEKTLDWTDRQILSMISSNVRRVTITRKEEGDNLVIQRELPRADLKIPALPAETTLKVSILNEITYLPDPLNFLAAKKREHADADNLEPAITVVYENFDGLAVTIDAIKDDDEVWLSISSTAQDTASIASKIEAERIEEKIKPWVFRVPERLYDDLNKSAEDFIEH